MNLEELRGKLSYQGILLGGVALLTSAALAFASRATEADIRAAEAADLKQSLRRCCPANTTTTCSKDTVTLPGAVAMCSSIAVAARAGWRRWCTRWSATVMRATSCA